MDDLHSGRSLFGRIVLSAPAANEEIRILNIVILVASILSILGAGWIMLSFCLFKQVRTFRHQLILGLAISDFWMAVNFLSSCAVNLSGNLLSQPPQKKFCSFNGFMTQLFVVQTDYWVLLIAVCTFLILGNYKHMSTWIQDHRLILWTLPWGLSALWAALGLALAGYGDIGAWCWFTSDKVRLLVNFIPRWLIIIVILALYARLYRVIYKAHNRFISFNESGEFPHSHSRSQNHNLEPETESVSSTRRIGRPSTSMNMASKDVDVEQYSAGTSNNLNPHNIVGSNGTVQGRTHARHYPASPVLKKMAYQMMSYPLVYMLIWTIPTTIRIYQSVTGKSAPFGIATVDKACIVIQGFADAVIYGISETSMSAWRERFAENRTRIGVRVSEEGKENPIRVEVRIQHDITVQTERRNNNIQSRGG
ncbi:G protein-coupled glucose receptor regulating Gpa2-domain-containing protein [Dendryphion nanum]|uniref:G protein-coupled glucose receptor regulating Gpa2-domain-containing protein n=1 Tax=Dendryphion nanum TaxID=256645 RepID=A0A9P9D5Y5_9PLEO|nr:G protein-coupled glucose receptor regulating Gpa2-domain-containing protein [Dendryphion nanum]